MAAPKLNLNAARNGSRLTRLTVGELPRELNHVKIEGRRYRRALETETLLALGEITATAVHLIDTASAATVHAGICRWLLRQKIGTMDTGDILQCSREILRAKEARDRAVRALDLDLGRQNVLDALYSTPTDPPNTAEKGPGLRSNGLKPDTPIPNTSGPTPRKNARRGRGG